MWRQVLLLVLAWAAVDSSTVNITDLAAQMMSQIANDTNKLEALINTTLSKQEKMDKSLRAALDQVSQLQLYIIETARSTENSGVQGIRNNRYGGHKFSNPTTADASQTNMHNHANYPSTPGLGEFAAYLNGIYFRTRHNDYKIVMKCRFNTTFKCTEEIEFPQVPPSVKGTVEEQIAEMKIYFQAWSQENTSIRADYQDYFRPALCYMEGMWTIPDNENIEESFQSDRHALDETTWKRLRDKMRFLSEQGLKDQFENFAYLPTTVWGINNDSTPLIAQWNYQILCHPLKNYLPKDRLLVVDNIPARISKNMKYDKMMGNGTSRMARFQVAPVDASPGEYDRTAQYETTLLDKLMYEIPGMNNYPADIKDDLNDQKLFTMDRTQNIELNSGYYSRNHRTSSNDANGRDTHHRGFGDENVFSALTTHTKIASLKHENCNKKGTNCIVKIRRNSVAVPLEIIYLTPLTRWNPYGFADNGAYDSDMGMMTHMGMDGSRMRYGGNSLPQALNGTNTKYWYRTPHEFFKGGPDKDAADTNTNAKYVLDPKNSTNMFKTSAGGIYISFPTIDGVNNNVPIRQRYFVAPFTFDRHPASKEVDALENMLFDPVKYEKFFPKEIVATRSDLDCLQRKDTCT